MNGAAFEGVSVKIKITTFAFFMVLLLYNYYYCNCEQSCFKKESPGLDNSTLSSFVSRLLLTDDLRFKGFN